MSDDIGLAEVLLGLAVLRPRPRGHTRPRLALGDRHAWCGPSGSGEAQGEGHVEEGSATVHLRQRHHVERGKTEWPGSGSGTHKSLGWRSECSQVRTSRSPLVDSQLSILGSWIWETEAT